jgi:chromosome segregation ATPase
MSEIQRFRFKKTITAGGLTWEFMNEATDGEWVKYIDHRAEVERLTAERNSEERGDLSDTGRNHLRKVVELFETHFADPSDKYHPLAYPFYEAAVKQVSGALEEAQAEVERLARELDGRRATNQRIIAERDAARAEVQRLTAERDTAQAEVERLTRAREALRDSLREALIERNDARYEAGQLRRDQSAQKLDMVANCKETLTSSRPSDEDITRIAIEAGFDCDNDVGDKRKGA